MCILAVTRGYSRIHSGQVTVPHRASVVLWGNYQLPINLMCNLLHLNYDKLSIIFTGSKSQTTGIHNCCLSTDNSTPAASPSNAIEASSPDLPDFSSKIKSPSFSAAKAPIHTFTHPASTSVTAFSVVRRYASPQ